MSTAISLRRLPVSSITTTLFEAVDAATAATVATIISSVRDGGEEALRSIAVKFNDIPTLTTPIILTPHDLQQAYDRLPATQRDLLHRTADRIRRFADAQRASVNALTLDIDGGSAGHTVVPVMTAGCYAPGGRFPLPSSVLMTALTARAAGVGSVWVASPRPAEITKAAAHVAGADGMLTIGGAQAVAAFAYGIGGVPVCDVICGPGNKYVTAAKKHVYGTCGIDMLAGPSELLVIADDSADADVVAADLLAQAEHDTEARPMLVTTSEELVQRVEKALTEQLAVLPTAATASEAVKKGFAVVCQDIAEAVSVTNKLAPEHLEVLCRDYERVGEELSQTGSYGGIFIGPFAAEVLGDYGAGPNHTLPTSGTARYSAGLSVFHFLRIRTFMKIKDANKSQQLVRDSIQLAELEGLIGHSRSAAKRLIHADDHAKPNGHINGNSVADKVNTQSPSTPAHVDPRSLIRPDFRHLMDYSSVQPLEVIAEQIGMPVDALSKLNANENLYGPLQEVRTEIGLGMLHIYSDPDQNALRRAVAAHSGMKFEQICCGAGADELIDLAIKLVDAKAIVTSSPTFPMYKFFAQIAHKQVIDVPLGPPPLWELDVNGIVSAIRHGGATVVFIVTPNNPTGTTVPLKHIARLCQESALIVVDEAYIDFDSTQPSAVTLVNEYGNLLILRTMSKWAALAGVRCGYMIGHPSLIRPCFQIKQPYNLSVTASAAGVVSLKGASRLQQAVTALNYERARLLIQLSLFSWLKPQRSNANFMLIEVNGRAPRALQADLHKAGVLVRCYAGGEYRSLDSYIRISAGRPQDTDRLLEVLTQIETRHQLANEPTALPPLLSRLSCPVRVVLFDMDGVIADVSQSYRSAIIETAAAFGVNINNSDITALKNKGNANNDWIVTHRLINRADVSLEQVTERFQTLYLGSNGVGGLRERERLLISPDLLAALSAHCPLGIVTGRPRCDAEYFLSANKIAHFFKAVVCMEDAKLKPSAEPVLLALSKLGFPSKTANGNAQSSSSDDFANGYAVMIGDTPDDIVSAVSANGLSSIPVIGLGIPPPTDARPLETAEALYKAGAARVLLTLIQLEQIVLTRPFDIYQDFTKHKTQSQQTSSAPSSDPHSFPRAANARYAQLTRTTNETTVFVSVNLDGTGKSHIHTGLGYLDHMCTALAKHGHIDIVLKCTGDLIIDDHHSTEDCALTLGQAILTAVGDKKGITRFGSAFAPLDEALARAVVDISGRPHSTVSLQLKRERIGQISTEMLVHFINSLAVSAMMTVHLDVLRGENDHHKAESAFKALAVALRQALKLTGSNEVPSTKGVL